ncbi:MAG TPA: hypothetical protein PLL36_09665, partial [Candidatus Hydrogenedentes bacterium]|nr:hypothetical protein [Candidatus Hydrogenedentota bacterium]
MRFILIVAVAAVLAFMSHAEVIENETLAFSLDYDTGTFQLTAKTSGLPACSGTLGSAGDAVSIPDAPACVVDGLVYEFRLEAGSAFLAVSVAKAPNTPEQSDGMLNTPVFLMDFNTALDKVHVLGCDGLTDGNAARVGYTFLAAA